jgi:hypothetical protein
MNSAVSTKDPVAVGGEVQAIYLALFPEGDPLYVSRVFGWVIECFNGRYRDYQAVDALYHDLEHTLQGTLCMARLLRARQAAGGAPALTQRAFELGILAILLHDTGYLKKLDDQDGTGAKYTAIHVDRSAQFAEQLLGEKGVSAADIKAIQNMIRCTGVNANLPAIPFQSEIERITGYALATADLLGQMAADDYVEKLPELYEEFAEAAHFSPESARFAASFTSVSDLLAKTPSFWEKFVLVKLERDFLGLYRFLHIPYPDGPNDYLRRIQGNIDRLKQRLVSA